MQKKRTALAASVVGIAVVGTLAFQGSAQADLAPQPKDVVTVGSDIQQNAFNFLADGYGALPGYNTAGNKWRFVNFDSSGDANGRSAYIDPTTVANYTGSLDGDATNEKYVKISDVKVLNPTASLAAGAPNEVRPSGGNGGITALIQDFDHHWIDVARSPNLPTTQNNSTALSNLSSAIHTVQIGIDKDLIAAATDTNAPAGGLTLKQVAWIYHGQDNAGNPILKWKDLNPAWADETIVPLVPPTSAGMRDVFLRPLAAYWGQAYSTTDQKNAFSAGYVNNPNLRTVQQNDPTTITAIADPAVKKNAIVPFPRGRFKLLEAGFYANPSTANSYTANPASPRSALSVAGLQLLNENGADAGGNADSVFVVDFPYNAIFRESDYQSNTPWQPGSTLNWVQALFYNPGGPTPFVNTEAGHALLEAAGIEPNWVDRGIPGA
ncbi:hypothetical protein [Marmoricola sp. RAF53]|uniref:hypothetical protein n=1 Tax=Marmoricola sp. RAF53 TaxID=3233059 RepID=UPI003F961F2E